MTPSQKRTCWSVGCAGCGACARAHACPRGAVQSRSRIARGMVTVPGRHTKGAHMPDQIRSTSATCASACESTPRSYLFTSESVTEGHPDKIADQISDAVLDAILDKEARLEAMGYVDGRRSRQARKRAMRCRDASHHRYGRHLGRDSHQAYVDVQQIARDVICRIGYDRAEYGFDGHACGVINMIHGQSSDIAQGVDESLTFRPAPRPRTRSTLSAPATRA